MKSARPSKARRKARRIRLLLVNNHDLILEALRFYFTSQSNCEVVGMAADTDDAIRQAREHAPDVVILNSRLPQIEAAKTTRLLIDALPRAKVIGYSSGDDRKSVLATIRAGALGYLIQNGSPGELFRAVEVVNRGESFFSPPVSRMIQEDYLRQMSRQTNARDNSLSVNERKILALIADGLSNKEIACRLDMSVRTIEKYREKLMAKLQIKSVAGLTKFAVRLGISSLE
jgi:DNA-binding NarL/FixJ family response regulator